MSTQGDMFGEQFRKLYPLVPGFKGQGETSQAAAESVAPRAGILRDRVLAILTRWCLTADEIAGEMGESVLSIRPRVAELATTGRIVDSGARRRNVSGRFAVVWRVPPP